MLRRNGGMPKVIVGVVAFFGLVYFIYLYNDLSGQLKNTQHSAERYRREQESVSAQLQDSGVNQQQGLNHGGGFLPENMHQNIQGALQGLKQQFPNNDDTLGKIVHGLGNLHENLLQDQHGGQTAQENTKSGNQDNFNLVDDILKSVQDKHKPVDAALLEEQQKQHQIIPPGDHDSEKNPGYQRQAQNVLGQDGHGVQQQQHPQQQEVHQVVKPNFDDNNQDDKDAHHENNDVFDMGPALAMLPI